MCYCYPILLKIQSMLVYRYPILLKIHGHRSIAVTLHFLDYTVNVILPLPDTPWNTLSTLFYRYSILLEIRGQHCFTVTQYSLKYTFKSCWTATRHYLKYTVNVVLPLPDTQHCYTTIQILVIAHVLYYGKQFDQREKGHHDCMIIATRSSYYYPDLFHFKHVFHPDLFRFKYVLRCY